MPDIENGRPVRRIFVRRLYDGRGDSALRDQLIEIDGGRIRSVAAAQQAPAGAIDVEIIAPGFIDLQINGASDVQFNDMPTARALAQIADGARLGGTAHILPTFITAPGQDYLRALAAARDAMADKVPGILGLHLEGPFLSPERPGIHDPKAIRPMTAADLAALAAPFPGPLLVTLAPECQPEGTVEALTRAGVLVFAGHSQATHAQIVAAEAQGLRGVTHLFNAMSQLTGREPGVVGAALASGKLFAGIIADGHHVAWDSIRIATRAIPGRLCLVTDAMRTLAGKVPTFTMHGETIRLSGGRLTNADGTLAGAHVAMDESVRNLLRENIVAPAEALRMASTYPARALRLDGELGVVAPGFRASLTVLDAAMVAQGVVVDGSLFVRPQAGHPDPSVD